MNSIKMLIGIGFCFLVGMLLTFFHVPMALMFGPILVIIVAHRFRISFTLPKHTLTFVQLTLGTSVGLMFTDVDLSQFDNLLLLLVTLVVCLAIQFTVSYLWFHKRIGWTKQEAMLGAVPGAMAAILALMDHTDTPPQKIVISHTIRLIILIALAGFVVGSDGSPSLPNVLPQMSLLSIGWLLVVVVAGFLSGKLLERLHVPAPYMLTSLGAATLIQSMITTHITFPMILNELSMVLIGMNIGSHFVVFPLRSLIKNIYSSAQVVIVNIFLTILVAYGAAQLTGFPFPLLLLSWAPGSMEAMTFAAIAMGLDAGFVMINHIIRMIIIQSIPSIVLYVAEQRAKKAKK